ncbi:MAG: sigma-54-dependent transcriptional regulator, partial [Planctomycetota bacterium]|jgi:DNA-binding NtrC family response regulator
MNTTAHDDAAHDDAAHDDAAHDDATRGERPGRILVVDDHAPARESMADALGQAGHQVHCCSSAAEALQVLGRESYDCVVTDLKMPGMNGLEFIVHLEQRRLDVQVVMVTAHATVASAVEAMRHGAFDYIEKPFDVDQLERLVSQAIRHGRMLGQESGSHDRPRPFGDASETPHRWQCQPPVMIGSSPQMQALRERIAQVGPTPETVLISGESGTGKELVAKAIHAASHRRDAPLVSLNCPVLSAHLMESELFGHERGAFTGADAPRTGRFQMADGGSILLDEVTEIDLPLQAKLLRVLQERSFERVGSSQTVRVDVRVLATTNRDLQAEVAAERFREDLYYRLAVVPIQIPPLRQRRGDVPELTDYFFRRCAERLQKEPCTLETTARELMADYHWPGNVRELENIVTRASVLNLGAPVSADELRRWLIAEPGGSGQAQPADVTVGLSLHEMERKLIEATLERYSGHRAKTAEALGIGIRTLSGKLRQYGYAPREKTFSKAG